tara:strand:- start:390 stop:803 length:414 start_codon:yes stop_codon:yes gene_type:complete
MKTITITVSDRDYDLLTRIAKADNRRLSDMSYLCYAEGLEYLFMDNELSVKKNADEYFPKEQKQLAKNKELEKEEGFNNLSWDQKKAKGYDYVSDYLSNHEQKENGSGHYDPLVQPLVEKIKAYATEDIKEEVALCK